MRILLFIILSVSFLFSNQLLAQNTSEQLDINNINAQIGVETLFNNRVNLFATSGFEVPKGSGKHTMFVGNLWIAGQDAGGQLKGYAATFGTDTNRRGGPIMNPGAYSPADTSWDRVWKVSALEVQDHINNYNTAGYVMPESFVTWPGNGDTSKGQAALLAPFFDIDNDNFYDPTIGDYPLIKGDQAIYFIYNDIRGSSELPKMRVEIHGMAYAFDCAADSAINNTIFLDYTLINRSSATYFDTHIGFFGDFDIGNAEDDYVGSDVERGTFYGYNGDAMDEDNNGSIGYGTHPPAQGITFLKGVTQDVDGTDNPLTPNIQDAINMNGIPYAGLGTGYGDGVIDNESLGMKSFLYYFRSPFSSGPHNGDPITALDHYNYLRGIWRDGTNMVHGGDGHISSGGTTNADFMFPGDSDPLLWSTSGVSASPASWTEFNTGSTGGGGGGANTPFDRRGLGSTGPFTFLPGMTETITLSFTTGIDYQTTGNLAGISVMQERVDSVRSYYRSNSLGACGGIVGIDENDLEESLLTVYPNPFNDQLTINYELKSDEGTMEIYNLIGEKLITTTIAKNQTKMSLSQLKNGIYFIQIIDGNNQIMRKIIKQ